MNTIYYYVTVHISYEQFVVPDFDQFQLDGIGFWKLFVSIHSIYIYSELYEICLRINLYSTCKLHFIFQFRLSLIVIISLRRQRLFDCYSNQTLLSTFDSYDWGWRTRQMKIRRKMDERIKNNSKVKPKFFVDKCNGFRSIWIQIETRKRFGELLGK